MQTVRDDAGDRYLLVKRSAESSRIRDPDTGEEEYRPNDALTFEAEALPSVEATAIPEPVRRVVTAAHDDRSLGLLIDLVDRGPLPVAELLSTTDLCESDLHGLVMEFRAAGLVVETSVHGERGYDATETAAEAVATLRTVGSDEDRDR
jgi:hypothetical protein